MCVAGPGSMESSWHQNDGSASSILWLIAVC